MGAALYWYSAATEHVRGEEHLGAGRATKSQPLIDPLMVMVRLLMSPQPTLKPFCCYYLCDRQNGAACLKWTTTTGQFDASASPRPYRGPTLPRRSTSSQGNRPFKVSTVHLLLPELKSAPPPPNTTFRAPKATRPKEPKSERTRARSARPQVQVCASTMMLPA